ncbi:MAG: dihydropteroate synthase [Deltaproteobacteria bacterium]|uniref:Dihydropteroate synthase n=1 Tax=Candidatus Zymogenus saltonus TaxID=2844893 RepID=A0A9D8PP82_9DELT|nr:dihydropteroate synthase [Candidatus Zymogenus saltonus]
MISRCEEGNFRLPVGGRNYDLKGRTLIMGIVNVTPDSFSDGGKHYRVDDALNGALKMIDDGAHIIDIGGESTRPGAESITIGEELDRVIPVIEGVRERSDVPISIDTYKSKVAKEAVVAGASMINDISGMRFDEEMAPLAAELGIPVVLMHIKGTPKDMQKNPTYDDLTGEITDYLGGSIEIAVKAGVDFEKIIVDPGIGFGKTWDDNLTIIKRITDFYVLGRPVLIGASQKAFIGGVTGRETGDRLWGSLGAAAAAAIYGAHIVRVHNVPETKEVIEVIDAVKRESIERRA